MLTRNPQIKISELLTIQMPDKIGTLANGAWGDAVIFEKRNGEFQLIDANGTARISSQILEPIVIIKSGRIYRHKQNPY
ncbi:hypothetical protein JT359_08995 [Candidatus Poribacteria bacterium]|nr:hypothetical protein [Candidatus Poribacteria bacterium]